MTAVICIGAGPAGLSAAYYLAQRSYRVTVLEADSEYIGGISRTVEREGFSFDIGGHRFFSKSAEINRLWQEILGEDLLLRPRKSRIYYRGKFYPYPLNLSRTLRNLGPLESLRCLFSYLRARIRPERGGAQNFEQFVSRQFGQRLFRIFFKTYTEKVWGMRCEDISADWAAQRIKGLSLGSALKHALLPRRLVRGAVVKSLIETFFYPRKGPGMMWQKAAQAVEAMGGDVIRGARVDALHYAAAAGHWQVGYRCHSTGKQVQLQATQIISSMPLQELIACLSEVDAEVREAAARLRYRDFITVALVVKDRQLFDDNWIYVHDPQVQVGRIQNFKSWSAEMVPDAQWTCYGMEYFCFEGDALWNRSDEAMVALASKELVQLGLAQAADIQQGYMIRQKKAYPVYDADYKSRIALIRRWLEMHCPGLQLVGRNGMHKYNNQDHSMMTAILAAKNILAGERRYDVWRVNQDAEYLESTTA